MVTNSFDLTQAVNNLIKAIESKDPDLSIVTRDVTQEGSYTFTVQNSRLPDGENTFAFNTKSFNFENQPSIKVYDAQGSPVVDVRSENDISTAATEVVHKSGVEIN